LSKVEVNEIDKQSGSTLTLGGSGTTVQLGTGASQTGFGREGSVNWQTGDIKTATFTAASGEGYFINQSSGITMNLPAGSAGAIVAISDYARNFATHNFTITPNGSEKIGGKAASAKLDINGQAATFVYVDSTKGWVNVQNAEDTETGAAFITATGGTETTSGDFKIHTFTGPGTFTVTCAGNAAGSNTVDYLVVAGGASGGAANGGGGGGGAGGLRYSASTYCTPAPAPSAGTALSVTATAFPIQVGGGGAAVAIPGTPPAYERGNPGVDSTFSTITSAGGGGGGGGYCGSNGPGSSGGSGGGGGKGGPGQPDESVGGSGNTPSVSPPQGNDGGVGGAPSPNPAGNSNTGGGGGGAGAVGGNAGPGRVGGDGGNGLVISINGSCTAYAGGGGGQSEGQPGPAQGSGGSGGGGSSGQTGSNGNAGSANTGGGGGGIDSIPNPVSSGAGGSGIVIIRYKFQ